MTSSNSFKSSYDRIREEPLHAYGVFDLRLTVFHLSDEQLANQDIVELQERLKQIDNLLKAGDEIRKMGLWLKMGKDGDILAGRMPTWGEEVELEPLLKKKRENILLCIQNAYESQSGTGNKTERPSVSMNNRDQAIGFTGLLLESTGEKSDNVIVTDILNHINDIYSSLDKKLEDIKQGQVFIYHRIGTESQSSVNAILSALHQHRIEQGEIERALDAIRHVLLHIQRTGLPLADESVKRALDEIYQSINSNLGFQQQLELSLPIIPFLLEYKVGIDAGVDLGAVWKELQERIQFRW